MPSLVSSGDLLKLDKTTEDTEKHRVKNKKTLSSLLLKITIDLQINRRLRASGWRMAVAISLRKILNAVMGFAI